MNFSEKTKHQAGLAVAFGAALISLTSACGTSSSSSSGSTTAKLTLAEDGGLISGWGTTVANTCEGVTITADAAMSSDQTVALTLKSADGSTFYSGFSALACTGSQSSTSTTVTLKAGTTSTEAYFSLGPAATTAEIDASSAADASIAALSFTAWPVTIQMTSEEASQTKAPVGECLSISVQDYVPAKGSCLGTEGLKVPVTMALKAGTGAGLYSDSACTTPASSVLFDGITGGGSCGGFIYLKDPTVGDTAVVTASAPNYAAASLTFNF